MRALKRAAKLQLPEKAVALLVVAAVALMLVPMLVVARYNVPCADDYHYGASTYHTWQATHSLAAVLRAAGEKVAERYANWQGTYSAMFLMALQPAVFGNGFYALVPFLTLGMLAAGTCFFCLSLFAKLLGASRWQALVLALVWLGIDTQLLPSAVQGFYWYNGAIFYTFFFGVQLFYFGLVARCLAAQHAPRGRSAACVAGLCVLGLFLGGGNLVTAFGTLLILACVLYLLALCKNRRWRVLVLPFLCLAAGFAINVCAPGNRVRQAAEGGTPLFAPLAVWRAIQEAAVQFWKPRTVLVVLALVFLAPVLWNAAAAARIRFRWPLFFLVLTFGLYAAQFCPTWYALKQAGPARLLDIIFYSAFFWMAVNLFYFLGWLQRRLWAENGAVPQGRYTIGFVAVTAALLAVSCFSMRDMLNFTSIQALNALRTGQAQQYHAEFEARVEILEDTTQPDAVLQPYSVRPRVLFFDDATPYADNWRNEALRDYYGKRSVVVLPP
ncbi:MAG TPA: hypothetical protein H9998_07785 [Candidatus Ruthenibacterium merdipullorum]|nr:hypothetical protein [Candidatus Ruthenibacterium merdipullorum]